MYYVARWVDGYEVEWRNLTWAEYRLFKERFDISAHAEPMDVAMDIYRLVVIRGPNYSIVPAGIPGFICKQQMMNNPFSGAFKDVEAAINMARQVVTNNYLLSAKALIAATLNYKPEEIDQWDADKFFVRLAQAELANGRTFDPIDPAAPQTKKGPQAVKKNITPAQQKAIDRARAGG